VKIFPDNDRIDDFVIHLSSQELRNLQEGINAVPHSSPWSRGTIEQMQQALDANTEYRGKRWL
jgi:hypothetical protein